MLSSIDSTIRPPQLPEFVGEPNSGGNLSAVVPKVPASWAPTNQEPSRAYHDSAPAWGSNGHWEDRLNTLNPILAIAHEELERLYAMLRPLGYWAVMADPSGVIVYRRCQPFEQHSLDSMGVLAGARWPEAAAAYRGLGAGRLQAEPVCTRRESHSSSRHWSLNSVAIRILNPCGQCLGSLGAFAPATPSTDAAFSLVAGLIAAGAGAMEQRLFRDAYSDAWILCIDLKEGGDVPGLLAIDSGQSVLAANIVVRQSLGFTDQAIGKKLETLKVAGVPVPRNAANQRDDVHLCLHLQDKQCTTAALFSAPIEVWSTPEFRQFRTRPRVPMPGRPHPSRRPPVSSGGLSPTVLTAIQRYIGAHLAETISVSALAHKAGLSRNYFLSAFSKSTGVTPHRYIVRQRNAKAADLLANTDMELADIAITVGFADQSHFTRSFSRLMDCTPSAFRRRRR